MDSDTHHIDSSFQSHNRAPQNLLPLKQSVLFPSSLKSAELRWAFPGWLCSIRLPGLLPLMEVGEEEWVGGVLPDLGSWLRKSHCLKQSPGPPWVGVGLLTREAAAKGRGDGMDTGRAGRAVA